MNQPAIQHALAAAGQAQRAGRREEAAAQYRDVLGRWGEQPIALNALGIQALGTSDWAGAASLFRRAIAADPQSPDLWMNLARAHRSLGDDGAEQAALAGALALDQRHFMALVRLAELFERRGEEALAAERWSGVLAMSVLIDERTPALEAMIEHARDYVAGKQAGFAAAIDAGLERARDGLAHEERRRFDAAIDHTLGRRQIYPNQCAGLHFPFLPAEEFFDRAHFPWLNEIEAQGDVIRAELEALLAEEQPAILPYVTMASGTPANKWSPLDNKLSWGAFHLWKNGQRDDAACARCPATARIVDALPVARIPGRAPTVFFSLLQPGTRLPAHTGVSNIRTVIHLPLIVPPGCGFRVGGETREWRVGEAWAFDDTIEHEAWNEGEAMRALLILDVWNPYLTEKERELLQAFYLTADATGHDLGTLEG